MFVYDVTGNMAIATSVDARGISSHHKRQGVKKMINGNVSSEFISLWFASVHGATSSIQNSVSRVWFYAYKKYKNGNSARRTAQQLHIRPSMCYGGSDNFSSWISGKLPKIATSNAIFSRTADRIAAKFCMTIKKIKSNDIFQNCVHSCSTLSQPKIF